MRALELTVYPLWTAVDGTVHCSSFQYKGFPIPVDMCVAQQHFTDAELSAEVWHSTVRLHGQNPGPKAAEEARRNMILERFANLPHHDATPGLTAHQEGTP